MSVTKENAEVTAEATSMEVERKADARFKLYFRLGISAAAVLAVSIVNDIVDGPYNWLGNTGRARDAKEIDTIASARLQHLYQDASSNARRYQLQFMADASTEVSVYNETNGAGVLGVLTLLGGRGGMHASESGDDCLRDTAYEITTQPALQASAVESNYGPAAINTEADGTVLVIPDVVGAETLSFEVDGASGVLVPANSETVRTLVDTYGCDINPLG